MYEATTTTNARRGLRTRFEPERLPALRKPLTLQTADAEGAITRRALSTTTSDGAG